MNNMSLEDFVECVECITDKPLTWFVKGMPYEIMKDERWLKVYEKGKQIGRCQRTTSSWTAYWFNGAKEWILGGQTLALCITVITGNKRTRKEFAQL